MSSSMVDSVSFVGFSSTIVD